MNCPKCGMPMGPQTYPEDGTMWCPNLKCGHELPSIHKQYPDVENWHRDPDGAIIGRRPDGSIVMLSKDVERESLREVASWAQAVLTAWNVGDLRKGSRLHLALRDVMIAYRNRVPFLSDTSRNAYNAANRDGRLGPIAPAEVPGPPPVA